MAPISVLAGALYSCNAGDNCQPGSTSPLNCFWGCAPSAAPVALGGVPWARLPAEPGTSREVFQYEMEVQVCTSLGCVNIHLILNWDYFGWTKMNKQSLNIAEITRPLLHRGLSMHCIHFNEGKTPEIFLFLVVEAKIVGYIIPCSLTHDILLICCYRRKCWCGSIVNKTNILNC